jgi:hypothetical protein
MFRVCVARSAPALGRAIHNLPKDSSTSTVAQDVASSSRTAKRRTRGGQNLSERYVRLESSLRQKGVLAQAISDTPGPSRPPDAGELPAPAGTKAPVETFHGLVVPEEPEEPGPEGAYITFLLGAHSEHFSRLLHVRLRDLRERPLRRCAECIQGVRCSSSRQSLCPGYSRVAMASTYSNICCINYCYTGADEERRLECLRGDGAGVSSEAGKGGCAI